MIMSEKFSFVSDTQHQRLLTNVKSSKLYYFVAFIILFIVIAFIDYVLYKYFDKIKNERQEEYAAITSKLVSKFIINDFGLILDGSKSIKNLGLIKNITNVKRLSKINVISGSVVYFQRGDDTLMVDLQPLVFLLNNLLEQDFYYQFSLNDQLLIGNIESKIFSYTSNHQINETNFLEIKFCIKENSPRLKFYEKEFQVSLYKTFWISICTYILFIPPLIYLVRKYRRFIELDTFNKLFNQVILLNNNYIKICEEAMAQNVVPVILPISKENNIIDVYIMFNEIETRFLTYANQHNYKIELQCITEISSLNTYCSKAIFKQIVISLCYNILYFMRGGDHIKKCKIYVKENSIKFIYDAFTATQEHMENCSEGIFLHLGNPYILDCKKLFQLLKQCCFTYEVVPGYGKNEVIIFFNQKRNESRVIQFKKK